MFPPVPQSLINELNIRAANPNQRFLKGPLMEWHYRAAAIICSIFGGLHNAPRETFCLQASKKPITPTWDYLEVRVVTTDSFATFDFDKLTRLVLNAHHWGVRVEIVPSSTKQICLIFSPRQDREGNFARRHPDIEEAVANFRKWHPRHGETERSA